MTHVRLGTRLPHLAVWGWTLSKSNIRPVHPARATIGYADSRDGACLFHMD